VKKVAKLKLAVFDVDGTLTRVDSCWRFIHERLGTWKDGGEENAKLYFKGEISYHEWAKRDVSLWKGILVSDIERIISEIPLTNGIYETFSFLHKNNVKIFLLTAGLSQLVRRIAKEVDIDGYVANELEVLHGKLTGTLKIRVSISNKGEILEKLLKEFDTEPAYSMAVGDDHTMIPVFQKVGLSIAFNPQSKEVEKYATITIKSQNLKDIISHITEYIKSNA
jgi:phosphoserine phosphatase